MAPRRSDDPVIVAARQVVEMLAADPDFRKHISEEEIAQQIAAGQLIPAERLQIATGLTLVPLGRIQDLERTLIEVLEAAGDAIPTELAEAADAMLLAAQVDPIPEHDPDDGDEEPEPGPPADKPDGEPPVTVEDDNPQGRRRLPTEPLPCEDCGTTELTEEDTPEANLQQTKFSIVRFRKSLCKPCMASH